MPARTMASSTTTVIATGWLVLAGAALGFFIGRLTTGSPQDPTTPPSAPANQDLAPILAELRKLNETLSIQSRRSDPAPTAGSNRESAAPRSDTADRFEAAVERLDQILKGAEARLERGQATIEQAKKGEGYPSLDAMFQRAESSKDTFGDEVRARHILWSLEDAIGRYGTPSSINTSNGSVLLQYSRQKASGESEAVTLVVTSGLVLSGWYQ